MQRIVKLLETYSAEVRWIFADSLAFVALALFLATIAIWAGLWTRVF